MQWRSSKCRFHACNQLIRAFFSGKRILGMGNTWVKPKMSSPPDWFALFSHVKLDHCVLHPDKYPLRENGTKHSITSGKILPLPVWRAKQEVTVFWTSQLHSAYLKTPDLRKGYGSINKWQENADTSCLARSDVWRFCLSPLLPWKCYHRRTNTNFV